MIQVVDEVGEKELVVMGIKLGLIDPHCTLFVLFVSYLAHSHNHNRRLTGPKI
jgi:hypothetical protein